MIVPKTHEEILIENGLLKEKIQKLEQLVSERRRIEEKLRESENWLRTIVEGTHALLVSVDINGHFTYTNDATARTLGYASSEELIGKSYLHFVHPEDRQRVLTTFIKQVKVRQPSSIQEFRIVCKDGTVKWFGFLSTLVIVDEKIIGQSGVAQDITGRKQAEEELRKSEEKYRTILENIEDGYFEVTLSGSLTFFNDSLCQIWGYPRNELLGMNYQQYTDAENADKLFRAFNKVFKTGIATKEFGWQIISKDGTPKHIETSVSLLKNSTNKTIGFKGIVRDITDRKQVEAVNARLLLRQRAILDNLPMMAWLKDTESRLEMINEPYAKTCGRTIDECIGKTDLDLFPLELAKGYMAEDREVCMSRQKKLVEECISTPDGLKWHLTYKTPIYNEQGTVIGTAGIAQDITARKQAEAEQDKLQAQLQQAQKLEAIGTLAGGIAHDFNNILGAIIGYSEMIRDDFPPGSPSIHDINQVIKASHRAKDLVKQILAFSRQVENQKIPMKPAVIVKEAIALLRSSLPTTITINQGIDADAGVVLADPTHIHQIVMNLATNAFHAMEVKGGMLTISLQKKILSQDDLATIADLQPGTFVQLSIRDTGEGILPEIRERMFDPFFTTKEVGKGTGLGLSMVYSIVKSCNGSIACDSRLGEGTEFRIILPALEGHTVEENESTGLTPHGKEHILLIDDEEMLAELGQAMLERLGYHVTTRINSLDALATFQNQPDAFDLIITDQTMPGMTGVDLARRILQIRPGMPIILCTGYSSLINEDKAKAAGIKGFAFKPLAKKDIGELIREVLDGKADS